MSPSPPPLPTSGGLAVKERASVTLQFGPQVIRQINKRVSRLRFWLCACVLSNLRKGPHLIPTRPRGFFPASRESREVRSAPLSDGLHVVVSALSCPPPAAPMQIPPPLQAQEAISHPKNWPPSSFSSSGSSAAVATAAGDRPLEQELEERQRLCVLILQQSATAFQ